MAHCFEDRLLEPEATARPSRRRGAITVLAAFLMVIMLGVVAFAIDLGYIATIQTELRRAADAGALAGANALVDGPAAAEQSVYDYVGYNSVGGRSLGQDEVQVETGSWNPATRTFTAGGALPSAVRVVASSGTQPMFFGRVFNRHSFAVETESIAVYQPRDIQVVLDFSASMNDDSELGSIGGVLTQAAVEANLLQIYQEMELPNYGTLGPTLQSISSTTTSTIKSTLALNDVAYPFPSGSWDGYINYVKGSSLPSYYRKKYGHITLVHYWLNQKPLNSQTPLLWKGSAQPVTAVKDAVKLFLAYLQQADVDDRVGLTIYNSADGTAIVEQSLTRNYQLIEDTCRQRQAGHYDQYTNIGDGIRKGREDLVDNARPGAFRLIVLMTDGIANRPSGVNASQYALNQAEICAAARIPIVAISLGQGADTTIMQQIADTTLGVHFNIPGGQTVAQYEEQLKNVFRQVADDRPLKLVK